METKQLGAVPTEKMELALSQLRRDIATLHRDVAYAEGNRTRWVFIILWVVSSDLLLEAFHWEFFPSILVGGVLVGVYRLIDGIRVYRVAIRSSAEPVEPMWDTEIDLS